MKLALALLAGFVASACSGDYPTRATPSPPDAPPSPFLWVLVLSEDGACVEDATVQVVAGQRLGESLVQDDGFCDPWDYGGGVTFRDLEAGVAMTLRASAPGYTSQEKAFVPTAGPTGAVSITLEGRAPDPLGGNASVSAIVIDSSGLCIVGAVVEVVRGQRTGTRIEQDSHCDFLAWVSNVVFDNLTPGREMVLRVSAPGYRSHLSTVPIQGGQTSVVVTLAPLK